jgi:thymidylate synthase
MIWTQRSVDYAVGAPSDFILAALYLITIGNETGYAPGVITFNFGDTHIYEEHLDEFHQMLFDYDSDKSDSEVQFMCNATTKTISQDSIRLLNYEPKSVRKFLLKA